MPKRIKVPLTMIQPKPGETAEAFADRVVGTMTESGIFNGNGTNNLRRRTPEDDALRKAILEETEKQMAEGMGAQCGMKK